MEIAMENVEMEVFSGGGHIRMGNVSQAVRARTCGGDVIIGDISGAARISTGGGHIEVGKVAGSALLKTSGGHIVLLGGVGMVIARTAGGHIRLEKVSGGVEAVSSGGNITVELIPDGTGKSRLTTFGGNINLYLPHTSRVTIQACVRIQGDWERDVQRWDILSDFQPTSYARDHWKKEIRATYQLNGGGENITLQAINGMIEIETCAIPPKVN
jgi:hypothetical protein